MFDIVTLLKRTYGFGQRPDVRLKLYQHVQREVTKHGEKAYVIVRETMQAALAARFPDRWFAAAISRRLIEKLGAEATVDATIAGVFKDVHAKAQ